MPTPPHQLALSVDLDEWFHSRRWVDGVQTHAIPDMPTLFKQLYGSPRPGGEVLAPTRLLLDLFARHGVTATFFVLGEVALWYPDLIREIIGRGHEIGCHGFHHVDMTALGPTLFAEHLERAVEILEGLTGCRPVGYRAPNLIYEPWATHLLEERGFVYDSTVCVSRPIGGKYRGWTHAPHHPYHPSYEAVGAPGFARLVELPLPSFPVLRLSAGSGITTRVFGFHWTMTSLRYRIRTGDIGFYLHPWEVADKATHGDRTWRHRIFDRHTGPWMVNAVDRILTEFSGRVVPAGEVAKRFLATGP